MGRQWPLPKDSFTITSRFAGRINPVTGQPENHSGVDLACPDGSPIYAPQAGTVKFIGPADGYGQWLVVDSNDAEGGGCYEIGHMWDAFATGLSVGDHVELGQLIAYVGSNGQSTGPHCHLTVWEYAYGGRRIDPETWLEGCGYPPQGGGVGGGEAAPAQPAGGTIFGVDVSEHQNGMSLAQAKREGFDFAIIRTTDGTYQDGCYRSHLDDAESAGMVTAAYHFCRRPNEGTSVAEQVQASIEVMGDKIRSMWLDVETPGGFSGDLVREFKAEFEHRGVRVIGSYSYVPYWENEMAGGEPDSHEFGQFWVAGYPSTMTGAASDIYNSIGGDDNTQWNHPLGNQKPIIWQFSDRANVANHTVDVNAFKGNADQLRAIFYGGNASEELTMSQVDELKKYIQDFIVGYVGPIGSDVKDVREQLTGGRNAGEYPGWNIQTVLKAARKKDFAALTAMEIQAVLLAGTDEDIKRARTAANGGK